MAIVNPSEAVARLAEALGVSKCRSATIRLAAGEVVTITSECCATSEQIDGVAAVIEEFEIAPKGELERLREKCNDLTDSLRKYVAEHDPIRMDMNDPLFDDEFYE